MAGSNTLGVAGPAIVFARTTQGKAAADVVKGYLGAVPEQPAPPGSLHGVDVAVVVPSTYHGRPIAQPPPSTPGSCG
jgi:hypothetical protein